MRSHRCTINHLRLCNIQVNTHLSTHLSTQANAQCMNNIQVPIQAKSHTSRSKCHTCHKWEE